jgi:hypothetical protein
MSDLIEIPTQPGFRLIDDYNIYQLLVAVNQLYQGLTGLRVATLSPIQVLLTDSVVVVDLTVPGAASVVLPKNPAVGKSSQVKDGAGNSATHNITVSTLDGSTIDGNPTYTIANNYQSNVFAWNGTQWNVI